MGVILLLLALLPFALTFMILFPENPDGRWGRFKRVIVAAAVFVATDAVLAMLRPLVEGTVESSGSLLISAIGWLVWFMILTIPFAISERFAGLFGARRARPWAVVGMLGGLAWSGAFTALYWWLDSAMGYSRAAVLLDCGIAAVVGVAAGLAWYKLLPVRDDDFGKVFE